MNTSTETSSLLLNPHKADFSRFDAETARILHATIDWFESRGKAKLMEEYHAKRFYQDFLDFVARERIFTTLLTPTAEAGGDPNKRWDTARVAAYSELLGFYGVNYWYPWQVTILGLGPVWQSNNPVARRRAAEALEAGGVAAFGLSEKEHGADIYSSDMVLTSDGRGGYTATGGKYYIGNGNCARTVSVFGRLDGADGPDQYVFFYADSAHPNYHVVKNVVPSQMYVAEFRLENYPVAAEDILHVGEAAFSAALNTVNVGKFNLCFGGVGLVTHTLYETITHAHNRILYGKPVTNFPHVRTAFVESYARTLGMRLFSDRAIDYFRSANADDRRYLLFNPITKMKVTTEAEKVIALLGDIAAAKGFEADTFLAVARTDVPGLPKLEGTVAVNLALVLKFMPAYLFQPQEYATVPTRADAADDVFLFHQGPARGLGKIRFHDWKSVYDRNAHHANVALFREQADAFTQMLVSAAPAAEQQGDLDFMLGLGELFTLIVYGHLILEQAEIVALESDAVDAIFAVFVADFSRRAVDLHTQRGSTDAQQVATLGLIRKPHTDPEAVTRIWTQVLALNGAYAMTP